MRHWLTTFPLSLLCILVIWYLCLMPQPETELELPTNFDKVVHTAMYLGLCSLLWCEYIWRHEGLNARRLTLGAVVAPILMSGIIELAQAYLTTNRSGDWADFLANTAGVLLAVPLALWVYRPVLGRWKRNR